MSCLRDQKLPEVLERQRFRLTNDHEGVRLRCRQPERFHRLVDAALELSLRGLEQQGELKEWIHAAGCSTGDPASRRAGRRILREQSYYDMPRIVDEMEDRYGTRGGHSDSARRHDVAGYGR